MSKKDAPSRRAAGGCHNQNPGATKTGRPNPMRAHVLAMLGTVCPLSFIYPGVADVASSEAGHEAPPLCDNDSAGPGLSITCAAVRPKLETTGYTWMTTPDSTCTKHHVRTEQHVSCVLPGHKQKHGIQARQQTKIQLDTFLLSHFFSWVTCQHTTQVQAPNTQGPRETQKRWQRLPGIRLAPSPWSLYKGDIRCHGIKLQKARHYVAGSKRAKGRNRIEFSSYNSQWGCCCLSLVSSERCCQRSAPKRKAKQNAPPSNLSTKRRNYMGRLKTAVPEKRSPALKHQPTQNPLL